MKVWHFLFGEIRGRVAISTVLIGVLLATLRGVVAMGIMSLPVMLNIITINL